MYQRIETTDHVTVMNKALYDNLQDGIDELRDSFGLSDESKVYNSSYFYKSGDLCIHDNKIYRCKENMSENTEIPHEWVSSEWEETSITDELTLVKSDIKDELESVKSTIEEQSGGVKLGIDSEGNPGYIVIGEDGADTVIPFKSKPPKIVIGNVSLNNNPITLDGNSGIFILSESSSGRTPTLVSGECDLTKIFDGSVAGSGNTGAAAILKIYKYTNNNDATYKVSGSGGNNGSSILLTLHPESKNLEVGEQGNNNSNFSLYGDKGFIFVSKASGKTGIQFVSGSFTIGDYISYTSTGSGAYAYGINFYVFPYANNENAIVKSTGSVGNNGSCLCLPVKI